MNTLTVDDVSVRYGGVDALRSVRVAVGTAELVGLVGPNGAGKSTLLGSIGGMVRPQAGTLRLGARDVTRMSPHRRAALGIGRTFQHPALFESMTVHENLTVGLRRRGWRSRREAAAQDAQVDELLSSMELEDYRDLRARGVPYGIKKLVDVARALTRRPSLLLLDEPGAGLNDTEKGRLAQLLSRLHLRDGFGAIVVEHDVEFVMGLSNRVYALDFGEVIAEGAPDHVRRDPRVVEAFLGTS